MKIVVCDSGVGGLAVLKKLIDAFPLCSFVYLSDLKNMPYGNKSTEKLKCICASKIKFAKRIKADCLVVACNTLATVGAELFLQENHLEIFSVAPPVEKILTLSLEKIKIFCTEATAKSGWIRRIIELNKDSVIPLKSLAFDIEKNIFNLKKIDLQFLKTVKLDKGRVYLSCTHYIHLKNAFERHFSGCEIFDGTEELITRLGKKITFYKKGKKLKITFKGSGKRKMKRAFYHLYGKKNEK